jgi:crotonobetainyl-CoA:carnitine CoA-transferase CaiB-like acyl-CoA transferase
MKVNTPSMTFESKQFAIRKIFQEVKDDTLGKFVINTNFVKMSESPPRVKWVSCDIGKDNDYIRKRYLQDR